jgi:glycosyltransferase involved in cell wall biosynthesis
MKILVSLYRFDPSRMLGGTTYVRGVLSGLSSVVPERITVLDGRASKEFVRQHASALNVVEEARDGVGMLPSWVGEALAANRLLASGKHEVGFFPLNLLPPIRGACVLMVHDLVDRFYVRNLPSRVKPSYRIRRRLVENSIRRSTQVIVPTEAIRQEVVDAGLKGAEDVHVAPEASVEAESVEGLVEDALPSRRYVLQPAGYSPHKNVHGVLHGLARLRDVAQNGSSLPDLVVTGIRGEYLAECAELAERLGLENQVRLLGRVAPGEYRLLLKHCQAVLIASLYEGFGLPVIEAQLAGKPLLLADIPALREVSGGYAVFFRPNEPADFGQALVQLKSEGNGVLGLTEKGLCWSRRFSWDKHCAIVLDVCERAARLHKG